MTAPPEAEILELLRAKASSAGETVDGILHRYLLQRMVAWIASSQLRDGLCLKGALLLDVYCQKDTSSHRRTQCADFIARSPVEPAAIRAALITCCGDSQLGASFDPDSLSIRTAPTFRGARTFTGQVNGRVGEKSLRVEFRVEHRDGELPAHTDVFIRPIVDGPPMLHPRPLAIREEAAIAERVESLYWRGARGVRFEDFVDLFLLLDATSVDSVKLTDALVNAFGGRNLPLPTSLPAALRERFFNDPEILRRWRRFLVREHGPSAREGGANTGKLVDDHLPNVARILASRVLMWLADLPRSSGGHVDATS